MIVNDNSADTDDNWANGTEILHTYNEAKKAGLTRMPFIPDVATFMTKGLDKRAGIFGCNKKDQLTIVFLPNAKVHVCEQCSFRSVRLSEKKTLVL